MTMTGFFQGIRELAHAVLPLGGLAVAGGSIIAIFVGNFGVPQTTTLGVCTGLGLGATAVSKWIDSKSFTTIQTAAVQASSGNLGGALQTIEGLTAPAPVTPVVVPAAPTA